ncbi:MAG TPA: SDR family NAD(P)-dependent oxidoreductase [Alphaproteobacteria bacterium]
MADLKNPQNIVITGASSGLGAALANLYAMQGVTLGLLGRHAERLENVANQCRAQGANVVIGAIDVTDTELMTSWLNAFDDLHPIDLCIANAGISAGTGGGEETLNQVKKIFQANVDGSLNTIHPVLDRMQKRNQGQVAIISSMAGWVGLPGAPAYGASKGAMRIYGQALRGLYRDKNIAINVVCPGFIKTPMTDVNPFPMPFMLTPFEAASIIRNDLMKNKGMIAFPWQKFIIVRLLSMLPDAIVTWFGRRLPAKPAVKEI